MSQTTALTTYLPEFPISVPVPVPASDVDLKRLKRNKVASKIIRQSWLSKSILCCVGDGQQVVEQVFQTEEKRLERILSLWYQARNNVLSLFIRPVATKSDMASYVAEFIFEPDVWKDMSHPLTCQVEFDAKMKPRATTTTRSGLTWRYTCDEYAEFCSSLDLAYTAAMTSLVIKEHFLYTHLLGVGTIFQVTRNHLPLEHPISQLVFPFGYQSIDVNLYRGIPLVQENLCKDWSFSESGFGKQIDSWAKSFRFHDVGEPLDPSLVTEGEFWPKWHKVCAVKLAVKQFVLRVLNLYSDEILIEQKAVGKWYKSLRTLPYLLPSLPYLLSRDVLCSLLTQYIYMAIYHHELVADDSKELLDPLRLCHPTSKSSKTNNNGQDFFKYITYLATQPKEMLLDETWPDRLIQEVKIRALAKEFCQEITRVLGKKEASQLELGLNK